MCDGMVPTFLIPGYAGGLRGGRPTRVSEGQPEAGVEPQSAAGTQGATHSGASLGLRPSPGHHGYPGGEDSSGYGEGEDNDVIEDVILSRDDQLRRLVPVIPKIEVQVVPTYTGAPYQPLRELDAHYNEAYAAGYHQYDYDMVYGDSNEPYPSVIQEPVQICYDPATGQTVLVESEELVPYRRGSGSNLPVIHESGKEEDQTDEITAMLLADQKETAILSDESDSDPEKVPDDGRRNVIQPRRNVTGNGVDFGAHGGGGGGVGHDPRDVTNGYANASAGTADSSSGFANASHGTADASSVGYAMASASLPATTTPPTTTAMATSGVVTSATKPISGFEYAPDNFAKGSDSTHKPTSGLNNLDLHDHGHDLEDEGQCQVNEHYDDDDEYYSSNEDYDRYDDYQSSAESPDGSRSDHEDEYPEDYPPEDGEYPLDSSEDGQSRDYDVSDNNDVTGEEEEEEEEQDIDAYFNLSQEEFQLLSSARDSVKASRNRHSDASGGRSPSPSPPKSRIHARTEHSTDVTQMHPMSSQLEAKTTTGTTQMLPPTGSSSQQSSSPQHSNRDPSLQERRKTSGSDSVIFASNFTHTESYESRTGTYSTGSPRSRSPPSRDTSRDHMLPRGSSQASVPSRGESIDTSISDLWKDNTSTHESMSVISSRLEEIERQEREKQQKEQEEQQKMQEQQEKERQEEERKKQAEEERRKQEEAQKVEKPAEGLLKPQDAASNKPSLMKQHSIKDSVVGLASSIRGFIVDSISSEDIHGSTKDEEPEKRQESQDTQEPSSGAGEPVKTSAETTDGDAQAAEGATSAQQPEGEKSGTPEVKQDDVPSTSAGAGVLKGAPSGKKFLTAVNRVAKLRKEQMSMDEGGEVNIHSSDLQFDLYV